MNKTRFLPLLFAALIFLAAGCANSNPGNPASAQATADAPVGARPLHSDVGFTSSRKLQEHFEKHGSEFGAIGKDDYLRQAQVLRDSPVGGNILEIKRSDGVVSRFNRTTGAFLAFNHDLTIRTYFKPNDGERYFMRQAKRQPEDD